MAPPVIPENLTVAGQNARTEFSALIAGCGVYELSSKGRLAVSGSDRVRWINGMVTNNIRDLAAGQGAYAFLLNPQGKILGDLYAYNLGESLVVETDKVQVPRILETFDRHIIMDDVEIADISDQASMVGVAGPKARAILTSAGFAVPDLKVLQFSSTRWREKEVNVARGDTPKTETYELWLSPAAVETATTALIENGATRVSATALEWLRIASGVPRYGTDIREKDLPQETEQQRALNFNKGCYIGQEIVERIRSRGAVHRQFTGFSIEGSAPEPGAELQFEGKKAGEITSVASLPLADGTRDIALGYVRREIGAHHKYLEGSGFKAMPVNLPFSEFFQK